MVYAYLVNANTLVVMYMLSVAVSYTYDYMRRDNENKLQQSQLETQILQARMKMLRSQLHPHFLFNTLNSVNSLMDIDVSTARIMIVDLSDLLRKVLDWKDTPKIPLKDELDLLKRYVNIEKMRFSDDLTVHWDIDESLLKCRCRRFCCNP
ncbi:MAG: histidine kinase [Saprospiraceae bacterium]